MLFSGQITRHSHKGGNQSGNSMVPKPSNFSTTSGIMPIELQAASRDLDAVPSLATSVACYRAPRFWRSSTGNRIEDSISRPHFGRRGLLPTALLEKPGNHSAFISTPAGKFRTPP